MLNIIFLVLPLSEILISNNRKIQFLAFLTDFGKILKMFLISAQNKFYVIMSSYVEKHVKKNSSLNFMSLVGFQASQTCISF